MQGAIFVKCVGQEQTQEINIENDRCGMDQTISPLCIFFKFYAFYYVMWKTALKLENRQRLSIVFFKADVVLSSTGNRTGTLLYRLLGEDQKLFNYPCVGRPASFGSC